MATQPRLSLLCTTATHPTPRPDHLQLWRHAVSIFVDISYIHIYMGYILSTLQLWRQSLSQLGSETCRSCRVCARVREQRSNFFVLGITLLYMGNEFTSSQESRRMQPQNANQNRKKSRFQILLRSLFVSMQEAAGNFRKGRAQWSHHATCVLSH